jgi:SpoVK/Ycf46/Vps4 family AAA+-type ATPase
MDIDKLIEALSESPDNNSLRKLLADSLFNAGRYREAITEYKYLLKQDSDNRPLMVVLAECYYRLEEYSTAIVMLENIVHLPDASVQGKILYIKLLLQENNYEQSMDLYRRLLDVSPEAADESIDSVLKQRNTTQGEDSSGSGKDETLNYLVEKPSLHFSDVGGMEAVKREIELKIIAPMKHPELYAAYGKKTGGGILLYGPPGCGKTYLARATAGQIDSKFLSIGINDILDMWLGNSEKNLHSIFELARKNTPCVLFFDEIDALGANRSDMRQSAGRQTINQFLSELDGIASNNEGILILGATNAPWHLDPAFRRPGRFDRIIFVEPPDSKGREEIFRLQLKGKPQGDIAWHTIAKECEDFSGADLKAVVDMAVEEKLSEAIRDGVLKPLITGDLLKAAKKHKPSTREWFVKARNYALYANESGLYDDILKYLKIKK